MSQPRQPQQQASESGRDMGRTKKVMLPNEWKPKLWGGWEFYAGHPVPQEGVNFELYVRPGEEDDWGVGVHLDVDDDRPHLLNPISVNDANGKAFFFWPDCVEDVQALLSQIGRYGIAQPTAGGWVVNATVTAAEARAIIAAGSDLQMVKHDGFGFEFLDIDATEAIRLIAELSGVRQESIDVMYYATYNGSTNTGFRIDQESVRILRVSRTTISSEELDVERERTGFGYDLHTKSLSVPNEINDSELGAYVTEQIRSEPPFDFQAEVVGGDLVSGGVVYNSDVYAPDGEGGVVRKTPASADGYPNVDAPSGATRDVPSQLGAANAGPAREAGQQSSGERPGTPGSRRAGSLPLDGKARRR